MWQYTAGIAFYPTKPKAQHYSTNPPAHTLCQSCTIQPQWLRFIYNQAANHAPFHSINNHSSKYNSTRVYGASCCRPAGCKHQFLPMKTDRVSISHALSNPSRLLQSRHAGRLYHSQLGQQGSNDGEAQRHQPRHDSVLQENNIERGI
jgi:hypothetical protein